MSNRHQKLERHSLAFTIMILIVASIGGIVEIPPLFTIENTIEKVDGMRPYTPLELAGRDIYVREGCYACHSQMIRTLRSRNIWTRKTTYTQAGLPACAATG